MLYVKAWPASTGCVGPVLVMVKGDCSSRGGTAMQKPQTNELASRRETKKLEQRKSRWQQYMLQSSGSSKPGLRLCKLHQACLRCEYPSMACHWRCVFEFGKKHVQTAGWQAVLTPTGCAGLMITAWLSSAKRSLSSVTLAVLLTVPVTDAPATTGRVISTLSAVAQVLFLPRSHVTRVRRVVSLPLGTTWVVVQTAAPAATNSSSRDRQNSQRCFRHTSWTCLATGHRHDRSRCKRHSTTRASSMKAQSDKIKTR